jgi:intracellular sulfur oxidation DsrE/DsrF family protein
MSSRRDFLAAGAGSALVLAATGAPARAAGAPILDEAAFVARIVTSAKHRQAIGAARVNDGAVLQYAVNTLNGFQNGWNEPAANVQIAVVLFGSAATIGLDDTAWREHHLADLVKAFKADWITADTSLGNPWSHVGASVGPRGDKSVPALVARGVRVIVCNTALGEISNRIIAAGYGGGVTDPFAIQAHLREHVLPGCDVVPAGISSIAVLQEHGYTYFSAAL